MEPCSLAEWRRVKKRTAQESRCHYILQRTPQQHNFWVLFRGVDRRGRRPFCRKESEDGARKRIAIREVSGAGRTALSCREFGPRTRNGYWGRRRDPKEASVFNLAWRRERPRANPVHARTGTSGAWSLASAARLGREEVACVSAGPTVVGFASIRQLSDPGTPRAAPCRF